MLAETDPEGYRGSEMKMIADNTANIQYSKIRKMFNKALQYENPINFTIGEPDFIASDHVAAAACKAILEGKSKYSENAGIKPLREAISRYLKQEIGMCYSPEYEITVNVGAMNSIFEGLKAVIDSNDEVIVIEPCWTNYIQQIQMCGGKPVSVCADLENDFSLDIDAIRNAITKKTKLIIINSPCNPTGTVLDRKMLAKLAELVNENDLLVISDEVYKHILFDDNTFTSISTFPGMRERTLVVDSFSKTFAMTGFRVGYAAGPSEWVKNITKLQENVTACAAMPCQYAALAALEGTREHLYYMVESYRKRRDYLAERIAKMPLLKHNKSKGTFYAFLSIKETGMSSEAFAEKLLEEEQVVVVPGNAFGDYGEGYIRISFASAMENIRIGMDRLEAFMQRIAESR